MSGTPGCGFAGGLQTSRTSQVIRIVEPHLETAAAINSRPSRPETTPTSSILQLVQVARLHAVTLLFIGICTLGQA
jgi:hypothetical protein